MYEILIGRDCNCVREKEQSQLLFNIAHQTATKRSNLWHNDLRDNCESANDYVFHLTCVMPIPGNNHDSSKLRKQKQIVQKTSKDF